MINYVDSTLPGLIKETQRKHDLAGITTNPLIFLKEHADEKVSYADALNDIISTAAELGLKEVHIQATGNYDDLLNAARGYANLSQEPRIVVKIPICDYGLKAIKELKQEGIMVNATVCMSAYQARQASEADADYVAFYWGRMGDLGIDVVDEIQKAISQFRESSSSTKIMLAGFREMSQVYEAKKLLADAITLSPAQYSRLVKPLTTSQQVQDAASRRTQETIAEFDIAAQKIRDKYN